MKTLARFSVPLLALSLAACAQTPVRTDHDPQADWSALRDFAWVTPQQVRVDDPMLDSQLLTRKVQRSTVAALTERGFREVPNPEAAFLVTYHTASRDRAYDPWPRSSLHVGYGFRGRYGFGFGMHHPVETIREGTIIIDVIDAERGELVWRGWSSTTVHERRYTDEYVDQTVRAILARFPPSD